MDFKERVGDLGRESRPIIAAQRVGEEKFALWGCGVREGARQRASRAAGAGSGLGPLAAELGRVNRGAGGGRGKI